VVTPIGAKFYQDLRQADIANVSDESTAAKATFVGNVRLPHFPVGQEPVRNRPNVVIPDNEPKSAQPIKTQFDPHLLRQAPRDDRMRATDVILQIVIRQTGLGVMLYPFQTA